MDIDIERLLPLIHHVAFLMPRCRTIEHDDYVSVGCIACLESIQRYDPERGASVSTYLYTCARNAMLQLYRKEHRYVTLVYNSDIPARYTDTVDFLIAEFPDIDKRLLYARYVRNETQSEIAAKLHVSQSSVARAEAQALAKARA